MELASRAVCGDRVDKWVRYTFTAHMNNEKSAEELQAQTRSPQDAYEYAIRREKRKEHSRTLKANPFGGQTVTTKQEPVHYINTRRRYNKQNSQKNQRGRGGFCGRPFPRGTQNTRRQQQRNANVTELPTLHRAR